MERPTKKQIQETVGSDKKKPSTLSGMSQENIQGMSAMKRLQDRSRFEKASFQSRMYPIIK